MGSNQSDLTQNEFKKTWRVADSVDHLVIWESKHNPTKYLEQYSIRNDQSPHYEQLYRLRKNNPYLVNAYALKNSELSCSTDHDTEHIFIERIRLRISNIQDVPYPSMLHIYDAAIHGYAQLSRVVGFFSVDQDQLGINDKGQVKVWLNTAFESSHVTKAQGLTETAMLQQIFQLIETVVDNSTYPPGQPTIRQHLSQPTPSTTFFEAISKFVSYMRLYFNSEVPSNMFCVNQAGGIEIINEWCRNHGSYGFQRNSFRPYEKIWHSKYSKSKSPLNQSQPNYNSTIKYQSSSPNNRQVRTASGFDLPIVRESQNESYSYAQQSINRYRDFAPVQQQYFQSNFNVKPQQQRFTVQPQSHIIYSRQAQVTSNPVSPNPIGVSSPPSTSVSLGLQYPQTLKTSSSKFTPQPVVPSSNNTLVKNLNQNNSSDYTQPLPNSFIQQSPYYPPYQELPNESRLQQQRVISQAIQIKQTSPKNNHNSVNSPTQPKTNLPWQSSPQNTIYFHTDTSQINNHAVNSTIVSNNAPTSHQDGKSSPQFLTLLSQLRHGLHNHNDLTQKQQTLSYYSSLKPLYEVNTYEAYSTSANKVSGQEDAHRSSETLKYESQWIPSQPYTSQSVLYRDRQSSNNNQLKQEVNLDPQLLSDLRKYK